MQVEYKKYCSKYNYCKGNYGTMSRDLDLEWDLLLSSYEGDAEFMWQFVKQNIISCVDEYILKVKYFNKFRI